VFTLISLFAVKTGTSFVPTSTLGAASTASATGIVLPSTAQQPAIYCTAKDHQNRKSSLELVGSSGAKYPFCYSVAETVAVVGRALEAWAANSANPDCAGAIGFRSVKLINPNTVYQHRICWLLSSIWS
jgi:hypothetical protein